MGSAPSRLATLILALATAWGCRAPAPPPEPPPAPAAPGFHSRQGRPIPWRLLGQAGPVVHLHAGLHGDEGAGVEVLGRFEELLLSRPELGAGLRLLLAARLNPDGLAAKTRSNANGVDLNRNFPASNWRPLPRGAAGPEPLSEPESRAVAALLERWPPALVVTLHAARRSVNWDGPCADLARRMAARNGYRTEATVGYPTPGSLGSWLGRDRQVPVITLELGREPVETLWVQNREALLECLRWAREGASPAP